MRAFPKLVCERTHHASRSRPPAAVRRNLVAKGPGRTPLAEYELRLSPTWLLSWLRSPLKFGVSGGTGGADMSLAVLRSPLKFGVSGITTDRYSPRMPPMARSRCMRRIRASAVMSFETCGRPPNANS